MEELNKISLPPEIKTETESELQSKLNEICPVCGENLYKQYKIFGKDKTVRVNCKCEREAYQKKCQEDEAKEKQNRLQILLKNSLMDKQFQNSTFEKWDFNRGTKQMYELGKRYVENFKECKQQGLGLLIYGEPGNGKTFLCSCIANELLKKYVPVICVGINALLNRIQETYNRFGGEAQADVIKGLCNADLLIIDDLGAEQYTNWSKTMIYNIIDSRYRSKLPLIITSNLNINPQQSDGILARTYDRRTEDRILEMCAPVMNTSKSIRIDEAKKKTELLKKILY